MKVYHVDISNNLFNRIGQTLQLMQIPNEWDNRFILKERYPNGISSWGKTILGIHNDFETKTVNLAYRESDNKPYYWNSYFIDILYEYERLVNYPNKLSRLECIFASRTLEEAQIWKEFLGFQNAKIYEIECTHNDFLELDSQYLNTNIGGFSLSFTQNNAYHYWNGHHHEIEKPRMELLIKLPVSIVRVVE